MTVLIALFGNIWFRRATLAVVIAIALLWVRQHYINEGHRQGVADESQQTQQALQKALDADRQQTAAQLAAQNQQFQQYVTNAQASMQLALSLASQRQQVQQQVAGMTPSQVEAAIAAALHKPEGQPDTPEDRKQFASCLKELPLCQKQVDADAVTISEGTKAIKEQQASYTTLVGYTGRLETAFTALYNDKIAPKRSFKCVWMWHCVKPTIKVPDLQSLKPKKEN